MCRTKRGRIASVRNARRSLVENTMWYWSLQQDIDPFAPSGLYVGWGRLPGVPCGHPRPNSSGPAGRAITNLRYRMSTSHAVFCGGVRRVTPEASSYIRPARRTVSSDRAGPMSCRPMGSPSLLRPAGSDSPGRPARFSEIV